MPVTAKLSKAFYDRLGESVVTELIDLLNLVDGNYRAELREANDRNMQRFEMLLDRRAGEIEAKFDKRFGELEAKFARRFGELEAKFDKGFGELNARVDRTQLELNGRIAAIVPAVELRLAKDARRNLAWFLATLIAMLGTQIIVIAR